MKDWQRIYRDLREHDPDVYRQAVQGAEAIGLNHHLPSNVTADIEVAMVFQAARLLGVTP